MKRFLIGTLVSLLTLTLGCAKPDPMPGTWTLYLPSDTLKAAKADEQKVPSGTFEFKANGDCEMKVDALGTPVTLIGTYKKTDLVVEVTGKLTENGKERDFRENGSLSADQKSFRFYGKDFTKKN
jgi:hypothetical protein